MKAENIKIALRGLQEDIFQYGKENLYDILHFTSSALQDIYQCQGTRIFLQDLAEGLLICRYALSEKYQKVRGTSCFISNTESIISRAFVTKETITSWQRGNGKSLSLGEFEKKLHIKESLAIPIVEDQKSIGVICLDFQKKPVFCSDQNLLQLEKFLRSIAALIQQASRYHQEITFSKQVDAIRKKNVASMMLQSSVKLIENLAHASVAIPKAVSELAAARSKKSAKKVEAPEIVDILAIYSRDFSEREIWDKPEFISTMKMENLLKKMVEYDPSRGLVSRKNDFSPCYFRDILKEDFPHKKEARKLGFRSLYMVPRFNADTGELICVVNYHTREPGDFSEFEKELLNDHAKMLERMIQDVGREHIEIKILSEIEALRQEKTSSLAHFLKRVLSMASELIGADTGTISLLKNIEGVNWLIVEDEEGRTIGAKAREWEKRHIPPLRVGGEEIPPLKRSLTGMVAHTKEPRLCNNVKTETGEAGFYLEVSTSVKSEMAVPVLFGEEVLGVISLDSFTEGYFTIEHQRILSIISQLIAERVGMLLKIETLQEEIRFLQKELHYRDPKVTSYSLGNIIGNSPRVREVVEKIEVVSEYLAQRLFQWRKGSSSEIVAGIPTILITGKTGSGKEFFFNNIYSILKECISRESGRDLELPIKKTNIAAYSGELTYSELFGHKRGAYTGADSDRKGILEEADGGIVFLDEIGDADQKTQVQLLRFMDSGVFVRLGENKARQSRVVLAAATNKDLKEEIKKGNFREDLFHRLSELTIQVPSLNDRQKDIPDLATHFLGKLYLTCKKKNDPVAPPQLDQEAKDFLSTYHFRGNVRELRTILLRALLFRKGNRITLKDVKKALTEKGIHMEEAPLSTRTEAQKILQRIKKGESDFWEEVYKPFNEKAMTKNLVMQVIEAGKEEYGGGIPNLALKLRVCSATNGKDKKESLKFQRFKNFIYKTIKITSS